MTTPLAVHMLALDETYGAQAHQRTFLASMARAEQLHPCTTDHSGDKPPTHTSRCYPRDRAGRMIGA